MEYLEKLSEKHNLHKLFARWVEKAVETSAYPDRARVNFLRFFEQMEQQCPDKLERINKRNIVSISVLFSGSQSLSDLALKDPSVIFWALHESVLHSTRFKADMDKEWRRYQKSSRMEGKDALCLFKSMELLRIGWRDLLKWADTVETLEDLSRLADVSLQAAFEMAETEMVHKFGKPILEDGSHARFTVLGLGKLGGRELNFSSDIDLIYLYDSDDGETAGGNDSSIRGSGKIPIQEFYSRLAQRMTSTLNDIGPYGNVYRVDLNLRPEGSRGAIVSSLASAELYYDSWGQPWEQQMLIKARPSAGSIEMGEEFLKLIRPFIFKKNLDRSFLKEIQLMKEKIDKHLKSGKNKYRNNVKLGKGGIREIEFIIQAHQLIYGGNIPWLWETNSLKSLHRIFERGLLGSVQYQQLAEALLFLRDLENRMQITFGRQVQILPDKQERRKALALKMNLSGSDELMSEYERVTDSVHEIFTSFFTEEEAGDEKISEFYIDIDNEAESLLSLTEWGFENPVNMLSQLIHIRDGEPYNHPSSRSRRLFERLLPEMIELLHAMPDKELAVTNMDKFFSSRQNREGLYETLIELPSAREVLAKLFTLAHFLADKLINQTDLTDVLVHGKDAEPQHSVHAVPDIISSYDKRLEWIRRERNGEELRIGISYLSHHQNLFRMTDELSTLAGEFIESCMEELLRNKAMEEPHQLIPHISVIGLGKLGRRELNYGSDLDIIFIFKPADGQSEYEAQIIAAGICRKLLHIVGAFTSYGVAYKVDTRLRPDGEKGDIAISFDKAMEYYQNRGALWERMALTGARQVAGSEELGKEIISTIATSIYSSGLDEQQQQQIDKMKLQMERERIKNIKRVPIKVGKGGIVSIEFMAQKLKLKYGKKHPEIAPLNTVETFNFCKNELQVSGLDSLVESYRFLRLVETHMRMESGIGGESLPESEEKLKLLEQKLAYFTDVNGGLRNKVVEVMKEVELWLTKS